MTSSIINIRQILQARPIKNFSVSDGGIAASGLSSLNTLPASLRQRYVSAINAAMQKAFGIEPIEIFWNEPAKQVILVHPTFLDKLGEDFGQAIESLPIEVEVILDERTNILYFLADKATGSSVKREGALVVGNEAVVLSSKERKVHAPPVERVVKSQNLAEVYEKAGQWNKAGAVYNKAGQWEKAADCYEKALQGKRAASLYVSVHELDRIASLYEKAGQWSKAVIVYNKAKQWKKAAAVYERAEQWKMVAYCNEMAAKQRESSEHLSRVAEWAHSPQRKVEEAEAKARYEFIQRKAVEKYREEQAAKSAEIERRAAARDAERVKEREEERAKTKAKADEAARKNKKWWEW